MDESTWGHRFWLARVVLNLREPDEVADADFGKRVAKRMRRRRPFRTSSVSQWRTGKQSPPPDVQLAIAEECGVDPGWLTYGQRSQAPAPSIAESAEYKARLDRVADAMNGAKRPPPDYPREGGIRAAVKKKTRRQAG
jgi:transcriptional regulator with XRE-family HTH domain